MKTNWAMGVDAKGQPIPNPAKQPQLDGALVTPNQGGAHQLAAAELQSGTGLFYVNAARAFSVYYLYDDDDKPEGWGGNDRGGCVGSDAAGDRLQDREGSLEPQVAGTAARGRGC